jgi:hypothetical protein
MEKLWDLAQSPVWQDVQVQVCLQATWMYLREEGWGTAFNENCLVLCTAEQNNLMSIKFN